MRLSVIIPAYNEEKNIKATLDDIYDYLSKKHVDHEIIVVVDGAKDRTAEVVSEAIKMIPTLKLIDIKENHGKGYVVRRGMLAAQGELRLFTDADNATTIDNLERLLPFIQQGYDVVIGSIGLPGKEVKAGSEPAYRILFGKLGNLFLRIFIISGIHDTQRGFKLFTAKAATAIFPHQKINRWAFDVELLVLARKLGFKIKEVSIKWANNSETSKIKASDYPKFLLRCLKIRWDLVTGKYDLVN